ncbi:hypothetical protein EVAR_60156_1 [Eumeta japonica]|uniref:Uncharacterized protein n=1 Tax=Eumeta variegata TaxID=151549 RepID=A0A4C1SSA9_EUMVA|nr:hypothetical protein EVAR_60156_1 [Eumeta japonica]
MVLRAASGADGMHASNASKNHISRGCASISLHISQIGSRSVKQCFIFHLQVGRTAECLPEDVASYQCIVGWIAFRVAIEARRGRDELMQTRSQTRRFVDSSRGRAVNRRTRGVRPDVSARKDVHSGDGLPFACSV